MSQLKTIEANREWQETLAKAQNKLHTGELTHSEYRELYIIATNTLNKKVADILSNNH